MEITISGRRTEVSDKLRRLAEQKVAKLDRFVEMDRAEVHFSQHRNPRIVEPETCEITFTGHGHHVRVKVAAADAFSALDRATEKAGQQLAKLKSKLVRRSHGGVKGGLSTPASAVDALAPAAGAAAPAPSEAAGGPRIVKKKRFAMMPMSPEEAVQRMDLLGHGFFFFTNLDTHRAAVVYRRGDGDVGLIDEDG